MKNIKTILAIKLGEDINIIEKCLRLFELRFKLDYKAIMDGKEYPLAYFKEWCERLQKNPFNYADKETARCFKEMGE